MLLTPPPSPHLRSICLSPEDRLGCVLANRLELVSVLGVGAYGVVYQAVDIYTNELYAVKALPKHGLDARQRRFQQAEIALHYQASQHPNVVSLMRVMDSPDCTYVVLEYCPEGDLFSNITERGCFVNDDRLAKHVFLQLLDAVQFCHSVGIYHRDLKPENVLVTDNGHTVKLADFGLATREKITTDFGCGSTFYMSPECQRPSTRSHAYYASAPNDVWSLGVMLVNLTCGRNPWKKASPEDSTFRAYLKDPNFLTSILPVAPELNLILRRIFECDPQQRISLAELREVILACPRFTVSSYHELPPSPGQDYEYVDTMDCENMALPPSPPTSPLSSAFPIEVSEWSLFKPGSKQTSETSTSSSSSFDSGYESEPSPGDLSHAQAFNVYGNVLPFNDYDKPSYQVRFVPPSIAVY
ncbi:Serine/threonine protein kinase [Lithohypha guttulata]|uniref:Serine/threonine-protein kinase ATG1 n=1 Tax=Lithohypha guttulata TaxID=1690604 RepID=A0AAN7SY52_9EURO|nr:Serine/threonine protein kinase [Lithohypha guttulata]KAK5105911.1 Serine/threonine protein kinase [Lithohypha guttulata]